ncbi:hypothetical protein [Arenimonas fontis]|uniref:hypothetical protein n=1 Tax=Arenimonas fontis TaxID=2608255 RepID=UPI0016620BE7|nr:hypothetical protein [Arenimonas fontis]
MPDRRHEPGLSPEIGALEQLDLDRPRPPAGRPPRPRRSGPGWRRWLAFMVAAVVVVALALGLVRWRDTLGTRLVPVPETHRQIEAAEKALAEGRLSEPGGEGARELFQAVLARDPDHPRARAGLSAVREAAVRAAGQALRQGDLDASRRHLALARALAAPASELAAIELELQRRESDEADIAGWLEQARRAQAEGRYDGPGGALAFYGRVLERQPDNTLALEGRREVLAGFLGEAERLIAAGELDAAAAEVARVQALDPAHLGLPALQARLGEALAQRQAQWQRRLEAAAGLRRAGRLEAAGEAYAALVVERPEDVAAAAGLDAVVASLAGRAIRRAADFEFDTAAADLERARGWRPGHPDIAVAERRLRQARAASAEAAGVGADADPERLPALLLEARAAMRRGELIEPPGVSAWDRLQVAASLAPGSPEVARALDEYERAAGACLERALTDNRLGQARACLDALEARRGALPAERRRLADRWLGHAEERLGANELDLARRALLAARELDPDHPRLSLIEERLRRAGR